MLKPNKHKGQHWLISKKYLKKIVESAQINPGEVILEIGPGTGNLTQELLATGANIIAIEKDQELVGALKLKIKNNKLKIIEGDILEFNGNQIKTNYKIVANIPYYITGPIIQKFLRSANPPTEMILLVQKEVGERLCAQPPRANYLSALVQSIAETKLLFGVKKENFWPKPKVDSVVIKITPLGIKHRVFDMESFVGFLKTVFRQPRQTLFNNLKRGKVPQEKIDDAFSKLKISKNTRPQDLSVEILTKIFETTKI